MIFSAQPSRSEAVYGLLLALLSLQASAQAPGGDASLIGAEPACLTAQRNADRPPYTLWKALRVAEECAAIPELSPPQRAAALGEVADIRAELGDDFGAEQDLRRALLLKPEDAESSYRLAQLMRGRPQEALRYADEAARSAAPIRRLAAAYRLAGEIRLDLGDLIGAQTSVERALELGGDDLETLQDMVRIKRGLSRDALPYAQRAARAAEGAPLWSRPGARLLCARIWLELKDYAEAMASLGRVLDANPDDINALQLLAQVQRESPQKGPVLGARASSVHPPDGPGWTQGSILRVLQADPDDLEARRQFIALKRAQKRPVEAIAAAKRFMAAVRKAPGWQRFDAYQLVTQILFELGDKAGASAGVEHTIEWEDRSTPEIFRIAHALGFGSTSRLAHVVKIPGTSDLFDNPYVHLAHLRLNLKDNAGAEKSLMQALEMPADQTVALEMLVRMKLDGNRPSEALVYADRLIKANENHSPPQRAAAYWLRARAQHELKDEGGAENSLKRALEIHADHTLALEMLVVMKLDGNRPAEALVYAGRLITANENHSPPQRAAAYWLKARAQLELKDAGGAEKSLKQALAIEPDQASALEILVRMKLDGRQPAEALAYTDRLIMAGANSSPPMQQATAHSLRARVQLELKNEDGAEKSLKKALEIHADHTPALEMLVRMKLDGRRPAEALIYADRLIKASENLSPAQRAAAYGQRAQAQLELKDEVGAEKSLKQALEIESDQASALEMLIRMKLAGRRPTEALIWADFLVKIYGKHPPGQRAAAYRRRAQVHLELKNAAAAQEDLKQALESLPDDLEALWMLVETKREQPREALVLVTSHQPTDLRLQAPWLILRGMVRLMLSDESSALEDFGAAVNLDSAVSCFGDIVQKYRDRLDSHYFDRCVARYPENPTLYSDRGVARFRLGQREGAVADFRRAVELRPDYMEPHLSLASALAAQERLVEALAETGLALDLARERSGPVYRQIRELQASLREATAKPIPR